MKINLFEFAIKTYNKYEWKCLDDFHNYVQYTFHMPLGVSLPKAL